MEDQWIKAAANGERRGQTSLYNKYKRYWFTICLRYQSHREDAEDVLQNALIHIFSKISQFTPEKGSFKDWSAKIVVNDNLMFLRSKKVTEPLEDNINKLDIDQPAVEIEEPNAAKLTKLLQTLPDGYREVFNLYVLEGYTHVEIAEILGISVGSSKSQLHKAKQWLKKRISDRIQLKAV
jgi:RNA polymerase sigma-70 factor (ECF subfamily)